MPTLSPKRAAFPTLELLPKPHRGKVRDTYNLGFGHLLVVCSDAISIFDFVLNAAVEGKGQVLNSVSHYWLTYLETIGIKTHLVAAGNKIDPFLPWQLRGNEELWKRAMVVRKLTMPKVEFIGRVCLTGSGLSEYREKGTVCDQPIPAGFQDGDLLPFTLDTPTTKAEVGHDLPMNANDVRRAYPEETIILLRVIDAINRKMRDRGFILADTKLEIGRDEQGAVIVGDEVGTPDSSRYWLYDEWEKGRSLDIKERKAPTPHDKQFVRAWGITQGLNSTKRFDPENPEHVALAHALDVPETVLEDTSTLYRKMTLSITGRTPDQYFTDVLCA